jgi:hypothetical protein
VVTNLDAPVVVAFCRDDAHKSLESNSFLAADGRNGLGEKCSLAKLFWLVANIVYPNFALLVQRH